MPLEHPARIVLIEDNPGDVLLMRHALDALDFKYQLEVLKDGDQALRFIRDHCGSLEEAPPCVVVLDLHLPKYDGVDILRTIRSEPSLSRVRVVAVTGTTSAREEAEIRALGVHLYRNKPMDLHGVMKLGEEIVAVCREHIFKAVV